jgi:2-keto-4-pentenoate hydratase/2-oxohepta-3-ene-1,7-dioic acid hydratase in catechol pathway
MKILRFIDPDGDVGYAWQHGADSFELLRISHSEGLQPTGRPAHIVRVLPPVSPPAVFAIGLNYRSHAEEQGSKIPEHPVVFMKSPGAVCASGDPIVLPRRLRSDEVDFEGELAIVIGQPCKNVRRDEALQYVLGYTCANDVSARDWQKRWGGGQFCRGKTFDTFCPLGPVLTTPDEIPDPGALRIRTTLNGQTMQDGHTGDLIFDVPTLIEFLSGSTTLQSGTVILTGTPAGVGMARSPQVFLQPGDTVSVEIEGIGTVTNDVVEEIA